MRTKTTKERVIPRCRFNDGVSCDEQNRCSKCGWNPEAYKERLNRYYKKHHIVSEDEEAQKITKNL